MNEIRVGIIDANDLIRMGRSLIINSQPDMRVVLEETEPAIALERAPEYLVDVLVVGESQHGFKPGEYIRLLANTLAEVGNRCSILVLAAFDNDRNRWQMLRSGAADAISLELSGDEFLDTIRKIRRADFSVKKSTLQSLVRDFGQIPQTRELAQTVSNLDGNQAEILKMFREGKADADIAKKLDIAKLRVTQLIDSLLNLGGFTSRNQLLMSVMEI